MADETMRIIVEQVGSSSEGGGSSTFSSATDTFSSETADQLAMLETVNGFNAAVAGVIQGFEMIKSSALDFAQKIESVAPNIQVANAQRDITMMRSFQQADQVAGRDIGELIKAQANSDAAMVRIESVLNKYGARIATPIEEIRAWLLDEVGTLLLKFDTFVTNNGDLVDIGVKVIAPAFGALEKLNEFLNGNKEAEELRRRAQQAQNGIGAIFRTMPVNNVPLPAARNGVPFRVGV